jgi:hypothetical protein
MSKKLGYLLAGGVLVAVLQWGVPAAYSAVVEDEAAESCPATATSCPATKSCPTESEV